MSKVIIDKNGPVKTIWMNRPEKRNALDSELLQAMIEALIAGTEWLETTSLRNDVTISGATITVRKTDGSTTQYTKTGTFTAGADILTGLD